jgi:Animal haem peroxidase
LEDARAIVGLSNAHNLLLESKIVLQSVNVCYVNSSLNREQEGEVFTVAAMLSILRDDLDITSFQENAICLNRSEASLQSHLKYRSMDGFGNNLKHPYWGVANTPFGRFGPKTYADKIHTIRKGFRVSQELPNPREIVEKVLKQAKKTPRTSNILNTMLVAFIVYVPIDIGHSVPTETSSNTRINCCSVGNKNVLSPSVRHSSCMPLSIPKEDLFYKASGVGCLSHVRSQLASTQSEVQFGKLLRVSERT